MSDAPAASPALLELARAHGIETSYRALGGETVEAGEEGLVAVLRAMGAPIAGAADATDALRARRAEGATHVLPPCSVAWLDGSPSEIRLRLGESASTSDGLLECSIDFEEGGSLVFDARSDSLEEARDGERRLSLPEDLPPGRHRLRVEGAGLPGGDASGWLIAAPRVAQPLPPSSWGAFLPVHAMHSESSWGVGDFGDMTRLARWLGERGATTLGVLPLLATWPDDPSPYSPVSRLAWNEAHVELEGLPELRDDPDCRALVESDAFREELEAVRAGRRVPHARVVALKHRVLARVADALERAGGERAADFRRFVEDSPHALAHATFRAVMARRGTDPKGWEERTRDELERAPRDETVRRVHLVGQWLAERQLAAAYRDERAASVALDLPIGVNDWGYDAWCERDAFVDGVSIGAPPDPFFSEGQDWGFRPLDPGHASATGHAHLADCLTHQLRWARVLRVDHVLGLRRLYWVPRGMDAKRGVYVRQPQEELFALLCLLSRRHDCTVVGENLGTVPPEIDRALEEHGIPGMHVLQFALGGAVEPPAGNLVASLDTHDTPTFAAFWRGADVAQRAALGWLDEREAEREASDRAGLRRSASRVLVERGLVAAERLGGDGAPSGVLSAEVALRGCLRLLGRSAARHVQVALEDLWLEEEPQNVPGTTGDENWTRRARLSLEEMTRDDRVLAALEQLARDREAARAGHEAAPAKRTDEGDDA